MDLNIIIMSAIIIAICLVPVFVLSRKSNQKKKRIKNILSAIAKTKSGELAAHEICGEVAVGITENEEAFVFYKKHEDGTESKSCILLTEIKKCVLIKTTRNATSGNIGKLNLSFEFLDKSKPDISLEFFNASETFQLIGELQLVEKWKPIIDSAIANKKVAHQTADAPRASLKTAVV